MKLFIAIAYQQRNIISGMITPVGFDNVGSNGNKQIEICPCILIT